MGAGLAEDPAEAAKWYRLAAEQGHVESWFRRGLMYRLGQGVGKDLAEAANCYRMAALQVKAKAQGKLDDLGRWSEGLEKDVAEKLWGRETAELPRVSALFNLGECYHLGQGVGEDLAEAIKWYRRVLAAGGSIRHSRDWGYVLADDIEEN